MKWTEIVACDEFWYNTSYHLITHQTPFEVVYGRLAPSLTIYEIDITKNNEIKNKLININEVLTRVKMELRRAHKRMKRYSDESIRDVSFEIDDYVYLKLQPYI